MEIVLYYIGSDEQFYLETDKQKKLLILNRFYSLYVQEKTILCENRQTASA